MTKRELKILSTVLNPKIAKAVQKLESEFDNYFIKDKKYKVSEYKIMKKIVQDILIANLPHLVKKALETHLYESQEKAIAKNKKRITK